MTYTYKYPMPSMTVDVVLLSPDKSHILCVKRLGEPFKGEWAMPGGFLELSETLAQSAVRELKEETSIVINEKDLNFVGIFDEVNRDKRGRVISACFTGQLKIPTMPVAADDAEKAEWIGIHRLANKEVALAFDHYDMVARVLEGIGYYEH